MPKSHRSWILKIVTNLWIFTNFKKWSDEFSTYDCRAITTQYNIFTVAFNTELQLFWLFQPTMSSLSCVHIASSCIVTFNYCKTLIFRCILISHFWSIENLISRFGFLSILLKHFSWHLLLLPLCVKWLHVLYVKMWKWNVNSVVLLY